MGSVKSNDRETGARKLEPHPEIERKNPVHTGDRDYDGQEQSRPEQEDKGPPPQEKRPM